MSYIFALMIRSLNLLCCINEQRSGEKIVFLFCVEWEESFNRPFSPWSLCNTWYATLAIPLKPLVILRSRKEKTSSTVGKIWSTYPIPRLAKEFTHFGKVPVIWTIMWTVIALKQIRTASRKWRNILDRFSERAEFHKIKIYRYQYWQWSENSTGKANNYCILQDHPVPVMLAAIILTWFIHFWFKVHVVTCIFEPGGLKSFALATLCRSCLVMSVSFPMIIKVISLFRFTLKTFCGSFKEATSTFLN